MKDKLLKLLKDTGDNYISGELISEKFNVSRTAVWKQINALRKDGYIIESVTNKGYKLVKTSGNITASGIAANRITDILGSDIVCLEEVGSTNDYAKQLAADGAKEGTLVVAETQKSGRGRLGRNWVSRRGKGIWMTVVLRPAIPPQKAQIITLATAVAVVKVLRQFFGDKVKVKWPNDVLIDGKKVCGILTEMSCEMENINYLILGIGINVNQSISDFPDELKATATSVKESLKSCEDLDRISIIINILKALEELYLLILEEKTDKVIIDWRSFSGTLGKKIKVKYMNEDLNGVASDITDDGALILEDSMGKKHIIFSGEILFDGVNK